MKKLNSRGFTHHLTMLVILAVVLGAMGFAGYRVYQRRNIDAQAATWRTLGTYTNYNPTKAYTTNGLSFGKTLAAGTYRACISIVVVNGATKDANGSYGVLYATGAFNVTFSIIRGGGCTSSRSLPKGVEVQVKLVPTVSEVTTNVQLQVLK